MTTVQTIRKQANRPRSVKCELCGCHLRRIKGRPDLDERCPAHPDADVLPWPNSMTYAMAYVVRMARTEPDMDVWVASVRAEELRTSTAELTLALACARRWQPDGFMELPFGGRVATGHGLFGGIDAAREAWRQ